MIPRTITETICEESKELPVLTLIGPRQAGKTTLVKDLFKTHAYANLENPEIRKIAESDPKTFFKRFPVPVIIDEIQRVPELLSWIQVYVDEGAANGSYIITGSHQLQLQSAISQSLAGRTSVLTLLPLSIRELTGYGVHLEKDEYLHTGFLPRIYSQKTSALSTYRNYFRTYVERDVRKLINVKNLVQFENFIRILAGRIGQVINLSSLGNDVGVSHTTMNEWLSILEASFIIFRLPPYYNNFGKRLIKAPKMYFTEIGLAAWLLGIESTEQIMRDPLHGQLFENLVVLEALKARYNSGRESNLYFWRDNNRNEVDLLIDYQRRLFPLEIKSSRSWNSDFKNNIIYFQKAVPVADRGTVVYGGEEHFSFDTFDVVPFRDAFPLNAH
jgi:uncharacterized protein